MFAKDGWTDLPDSSTQVARCVGKYTVERDLAQSCDERKRASNALEIVAGGSGYLDSSCAQATNRCIMSGIGGRDRPQLQALADGSQRGGSS